MSKRKTSSENWLKRQKQDVYCKQANAQGLRARSAFKLQEIQQKYNIIKTGMCVVDLGAAPGGWSQLAGKWVGENGRVFAVDLLPVAAIPNVHVIQGDFQDLVVQNSLIKQCESQQVNVVMSDMSPNISGIPSIDQPRAIYLVEKVVEFSLKQLLPGTGVLLVKVFQGQGFQEVVGYIKDNFVDVIINKPKSSRPTSKEMYVLARRLK